MYDNAIAAFCATAGQFCQTAEEYFELCHRFGKAAQDWTSKEDTLALHRYETLLTQSANKWLEAYGDKATKYDGKWLRRLVFLSACLDTPELLDTPKFSADRALMPSLFADATMRQRRLIRDATSGWYDLPKLKELRQLLAEWELWPVPSGITNAKVIDYYYSLAYTPELFLKMLLKLGLESEEAQAILERFEEL